MNVEGKEMREREKAILRAAIDFLCRNVSFGTLDVTNQRAAMVIE